jgi:hypothetical protein
MIAQRALASPRGTRLNDMIGEIEHEARMLGVEEIYIAAAPDLARDARFMRIEGDATVGQNFALRATVAYKGTWVRVVRSTGEAVVLRTAVARLADAVAQLPSDRGFAGFGTWLVEGCRMAQPLEPLMGSRLDRASPPPAGALVSVQGTITVDGQAVAVGAPALLGADGEAASLLIDPLFD